MMTGSVNTLSQGKANVPGLFLPHVERFVEERGGDVAALYAKAGINKSSFQPQQDMLSEDQFNAFVQQAVIESREPAFGLEIGKQFSIASFGLLSRALMSCPDVKSSMILLERYSTLALPMVRCFFHEEEDRLVQELTIVSRHARLNQIILEALISSMKTAYSMLTGKPFEVERIELEFPRPDYVEKYTRAVANAIEFGAGRNRVILARKFASLPFVTANPTDARFTVEQCEAELIKSHQTTSLKARVTDQIRFYLDTNPSSTDIASRLNLTERTMRRKLSDEGTSFRVLLQEVRAQMAEYYLGETDLQVSQVASKLGYQETSNFRAAFRKWTGMSPREWKKTGGRIATGN